MTTQKDQVDVLIIGTGIAGLSAAASLIENKIGHIKIAIITRESRPEECNSAYAQGGIIHLKQNDDDFTQDVQKASVDSSLDEAIAWLKSKSSRILEDLLIHKAKANFQRDENDQLVYTLEAAHTIPRILYRGDYTGKEIEISLLNYLYAKSGKFDHYELTFLTEHTAIDLITPNHHGKNVYERSKKRKVVGAYVFRRTDEQVVKLMAKKVILATGGIGALYLHHSNAEGARGDGHAMARRAGVWLENMEFVQFHPTTFYTSSAHRRFLISEAVRGEGGQLINCHGERFMGRYHSDLELAPRDVVSRAILKESLRTNHECVYLDISHRESKWIKERFPTIYQHALDQGIDITTTPIPVVPAAHYTCGGVAVDLFGKTNLENLYAVGEVACTGLHGANRLASTSLLEGMTWGYISGEQILEILNNSNEDSYPSENIKDWTVEGKIAESALIAQDKLTLKQTMWNYVGLVRGHERLERAQAMMNELTQEVNKFYRYSKLSDELIGLRNALEVANHVISASQKNRESLGCFYRED